MRGRSKPSCDASMTATPASWRGLPARDHLDGRKSPLAESSNTRSSSTRLQLSSGPAPRFADVRPGRGAGTRYATTRPCRSMATSPRVARFSTAPSRFFSSVALTTSIIKIYAILAKIASRETPPGAGACCCRTSADYPLRTAQGSSARPAMLPTSCLRSHTFCRIVSLCTPDRLLTARSIPNKI